jgi:hypothetical protein
MSTKLSALTQTSTLSANDLIYAVLDPSGTPLSRGITLSNFESQITSLGTQAAELNMGSNKIVSLATPTSGTDAATKSYVDGLIQGVKWKDEVYTTTTANITLSGEQTIDGVLTSSSRVLVKDQTDQTENGIYVSAAGAWTRSDDANTGAEILAATVKSLNGTVNGGNSFTNNNSTEPTLGVDNITFANLGSSVSHNDTIGLQGGTTNEYYHLTSAQHSNLTGGNPSFTTITGTLSTAAQPNVTSLGTLTSLAVSGDLTVDTDTLKVDSTNNRVGIGISSPLKNLHIDDSSGSNVSAVTFLTTTNVSSNVQSAEGANRVFLSPVAGMEIFTSTNHPISFGANKTGSSTADMVIDTSGNIGIGLSSPVANTTAGQVQIGLANATQVPTGTVTGGGILYSTGGVLHWLDSSGTDTDLTAGGGSSVEPVKVYSMYLAVESTANGGSTTQTTGTYWQLITGTTANGRATRYLTDNAQDLGLAMGENGTMEFQLKITDTTTQNALWGITESTGGMPSNGTFTEKHVAFIVDDGILYASVADGTTQSQTDISSGITLTDVNEYSITLTGTTSAEFFVNGVSKATISTNLPTAGSTNVFKASIDNAGSTNDRRLRFSVSSNMQTP